MRANEELGLYLSSLSRKAWSAPPPSRRWKRLIAIFTLPLVFFIGLGGSDVDAWPKSCTRYFSNTLTPGYGSGYCSEGQGEFHLRLKCAGPDGRWVTRWGDWEWARAGVSSSASCGPRYPQAFQADVFGR